MADPPDTGAAATTVSSTPPASVHLANHMPNWFGSIRFRLTIIYSSLLFGLAALVVGGIYIGLQRSLQDEQIYQRVIVQQFVPGTGVVRSEGLLVDQAKAVEHATNERAIELLRQYSGFALLALFVSSLGIGWVVAGRVLKPIGSITAVARDIQATDLSRRIHLRGPDDELKELADTFDGMLGRIDDAFEQQRQFIHEASHELRNPLAVIRTNLDVTLADPDAGVDDLRQTMQVVQRSTERMTRLVDDLLVYARRGTTDTERTPVDLGGLVDEAAEEFRAPAEARGLQLVARTVPDVHTVGDRLSLKRALANLLANAVRLAPEGSTITVSAGRHEPWVWMAVEDEGPGIAPDDQARVFQRFYRGDAKAGRAEGRSGLGLTIVRQIAEAHGGEVRLVSSPGKGSAFAVWLPAETADAVRSPVPVRA